MSRNPRRIHDVKKGGTRVPLQHHFLKDVAVWPVLTRFDRSHQGDLLESDDNKLTRFPFNRLGDDRLLPLRSLRKGETSNETAR